MKIQKNGSVLHRAKHVFTWSLGLRFFVIVALILVGVTAMGQKSSADDSVATPANPQTAEQYCSKYTDTLQKNACKQGIATSDPTSTDCQDYASVATNTDQVGTVLQSICTAAATAVKDKSVTQGAVTVTQTPVATTSTTPTPSPSKSPTFTAFNDILDQSNNLSDLVDNLHATGQDSKVDTSKMADDNPNSYVNGAGKQQAINVYPSGKPNSPAIVWFNGGGWHADDGTAYCLATGSAQKNCVPGTDGNGDSSAANVYIGPPDGGGANARGYTVIEVTYRLGSSGVYYMFEDVMRGLQHVINNAAKYQIDASKIAVGGDSAGGSLSMRAAASGKSGAKAGIGWSPPTNAYTGLFKSYKSLLIGMDHSTCAPTDLAGAANITDILNGGDGKVAQYGQGLSSNDFSSLGLTQGNSGPLPSGIGGGGDALGVITQTLSAGQYALQTGQNVEAISKQIESGGIANFGMSSIFNLTSKKFGECIDNFNVLSPALFASPETPPSFLAGFDNDDIIDPSQETGMRDKLRSLGIKSDSLIIPGDKDNPGGNALGATNNHMGYDPRAVCETINFINDAMQTGLKQVDCPTGKITGGDQTNNAGAAADSSSSSGSGSGSGTQSNAGSSSNSGGESGCTSSGGLWKLTTKGGGYCDNNATAEEKCNANSSTRWVTNIHGQGSCIANSSPYYSSGSKATCPNGGTYNASNGGACLYQVTSSQPRGTNDPGACGKARFVSQDDSSVVFRGTVTCAYGPTYVRN